MSKIGLCLILSVGLSVGLIFAFDPSLDLRVARFFHALRSSGATEHVEPLLYVLREVNVYFVVTVIGIAALGLVTHVRGLPIPMVPSARASVLLLLVVVIGPGLLVNAGLKENWSRPRPGAIFASGDETKFRAWWDPSGACPRNCSFVSGEVAAAFTTLALAVIAPLGWRYTAIMMALLYGSLIGAQRIAAGAHFVTDVVFAGVISALVVWAVHGLIYRWPATRVSEESARLLLQNSVIGPRPAPLHRARGNRVA